MAFSDWEEDEFFDISGGAPSQEGGTPPGEPGALGYAATQAGPAGGPGTLTYVATQADRVHWTMWAHMHRR